MRILNGMSQKLTLKLGRKNGGDIVKIKRLGADVKLMTKL